MNKRFLKTTSLFLVAFLASTSFIACGNKKADTSKEAAQPTAAANGNTYPIKTDVTLKYWMELNSNVAQSFKSFGDTELAKELTKRTGVKVEYIHPPVGQTKEAFNIMVASGDYPDIIEYTWIDYPGGPNAAINNNIIKKLNDTIDKSAPNLKALLKDQKTVDKMVKTDEGSYYVFPFLRGTSLENNTQLTSSGFVLRNDWLKELNLTVPETPDEWYNVLKAFKDKKGATIPFTTRKDWFYDALSPAFDNTGSFYVEDGKVKFGAIEESRKQFFTTMNKWYKDGLIDKNFTTTDTKAVDSNMLNGKSGAAYTTGGSGIGTWLGTMASKDPNYDLIPAPPATSKKGQNAKFSKMNNIYDKSGASAAISGTTKNAEIAAKFLDYNYGKEGNMLMNFGVDGTTYKMENNYPKFTDLIMKNSNGLSITASMSNYIRAHYSGPFVADAREGEQYYQLPQQKEALKQWTKSDMGKYMVPPICPTEAEASEAAKLMVDIDTYTTEMNAKFILGTEPIENFDKYVENIKKLGIDKVIKLKQDALDRYNKR